MGDGAGRMGPPDSQAPHITCPGRVPIQHWQRRVRGLQRAVLRGGGALSTVPVLLNSRSSAVTVTAADQKMPEFNYLSNPSLLANLQRGLSTNRIARYQALAGGDLEQALKLYTWNSAVSESLYGPLQALEILTRNRIHDVLSARHGTTWYDGPQVVLQFAQQNKLNDAKQTLARARKVISPPSVVSELSFGFWTGLLGPKYEMTLWRPELNKLFRSRAGNNSRKQVHADYDVTRNLRNRIAHHECVIARDLPLKYATLRGLIRTLCPDTEAWVAHHSRFDDVWRDVGNPWLP